MLISPHGKSSTGGPADSPAEQIQSRIVITIGHRAGLSTFITSPHFSTLKLAMILLLRLLYFSSVPNTVLHFPTLYYSFQYCTAVCNTVTVLQTRISNRYCLKYWDMLSESNPGFDSQSCVWQVIVMSTFISKHSKFVHTCGVNYALLFDLHAVTILRTFTSQVTFRHVLICSG